MYVYMYVHNVLYMFCNIIACCSVDVSRMPVATMTTEAQVCSVNAVVL